MPIAAIWMDLQIIITVKVVRNRKTNAVWYHLYVESKIWHRRTYLQNRNRLTDIENRLMVVKGLGGRGGMDWELGIGRCRLGQTEWINNKVLLYSTGDYIQYPVKKHNGKEHGKECMYTYNWITLLGSRHAHNIINQVYLNFKKRKHFECLLCVSHILGYGDSMVNKTEWLLSSWSLHPPGQRYITNKEEQTRWESAMLEMKQNYASSDGGRYFGLWNQSRHLWEGDKEADSYSKTSWEPPRKGHSRHTEQLT